MSDVLLVDWLGRGGIAQTTEAFRRILQAQGVSVRVASRPSEAIEVDVQVTRRIPGFAGAVEVHRRLVRAVRHQLQDRPPELLYLQNYNVPHMEVAAAEAARKIGVKVVLGLHNDRVHQRGAGTDVGLRRLIDRADVIVAHSAFVAERIEARFGREPVLVELPVQTGLLDNTPVAVPEVQAASDGRPLALLFGILGRGYKGAGTIGEIARSSDDWLFVAAGVGASSVDGPGPRVNRFLSEAELLWLVSRADVSLLPYRSATQSGAVVLSQVLATVPMVTDVGALREQVADGAGGVLLDADPELHHWLDRLRWLAAEPQERGRLAAAGRSLALARHERAARVLGELCTL